MSLQPHPLLLPNVLNNVLSYFSPEQLRTFRLVGIDWNHAACILLSNREIATFASRVELEEYCKTFSNCTSSTPHVAFDFRYEICESDFEEILKFLQLFQDCVRSLAITIGSGFINVGHFQKIVETILHLVGLKIRIHYFKCPELMEEDATVQISPLRSLKSLEIEVHNFETSWVCGTNLIRSVFLVSPNLAEISHPLFCIPPTKCRISGQTNIFLTELVLELQGWQSSSKGNTSGLLNRLTRLHFIMKLNEENAHFLIERKYFLRHLFLNLWCPEDEEDLHIKPPTMAILMSQLSPSLEQLGIDFPWRREIAFDFTFPLSMKCLKYLSLSAFQGSLTRLLSKLPIVENVELSQVDLLEILPSNQVNGDYSTVLILRLDFCTNQLPGVVSRLSRIFPNLRSLNVNHATDDICRVIFKKMLSLTYLRLNGDSLTDEGLTGIPLQIGKENNLVNCSAEKGNGLRCFSFIGDLPCLRKLKLESSSLTEASIKHGLVHCTSLQFVSMDTRYEKNDPTTTVTRTFRLAEYGSMDGQGDGKMVLHQEVEPDEDEDPQKFFKSCEKDSQTVNDLLFSYLVHPTHLQ